MKNEKDEFDLSTLLCDSLSLHENIYSQTRQIYRTVPEEPLTKLMSSDPRDVLGFRNFGEPLHIAEDSVGTPIQEFFRGLNLFITGGSGFIGKVLIEKLIRSVPHLGHIYLLIRPKRGKSSKERFDQMMEDEVFLRLKTEVPHYHTKITVIDGDMCEPGLGLSATDRQMLLDCVHIVFHSAADVSFIEPLKVAITSNVLGSRTLLELAKEMKYLKSYVHVSTAYSHCNRRVIEEKCYKLPLDYKEILNYVETMTDEELERDTNKILQGWPNTYTFSKAVCEDMVQEEANGLPICIFRPSVVWPTYKEPLITWTDNIYGPNGMLLAAGLGILHVYKINEELVLDLVPVDYVVNSMIAAARHSAIHRKYDPVTVYNYTSTPQNPMVWKKIKIYGHKWKDAFPFDHAIWYLSLLYTTSGIVDKIAHFFLHEIPGLVLDKLAVATGRKPRLTKLYDKISLMKDKLEFFVFGVFEFKNDNISMLWNELTKEDKEIFNFDIMDMDWEKYFLIGKLGMRYFYLKEKMENLPITQRKWKWLKWAHNTLMVVSGFIALKVLASVAQVLPI